MLRLHACMNLQVIEEGVSGELVVPTMRERLRGLLDAEQAAGQSFDWVSCFGRRVTPVPSQGVKSD